MKALNSIVFSLLFSLVACSDKANFNLKAPYIQPVIVKHNYSYLALGDSYTIGESVTTYGAFPYQLSAALKTDSVNVQDPKIVARTGWTTSNLIDAIKGEDLKPSYDIVTLLIGVNNEYQGADIETYKMKASGLQRFSLMSFAKPNPAIALIDQSPILSTFR